MAFHHGGDRAAAAAALAAPPSPAVATYVAHIRSLAGGPSPITLVGLASAMHIAPAAGGSVLGRLLRWTLRLGRGSGGLSVFEYPNVNVAAVRRLQAAYMAADPTDVGLGVEAFTAVTGGFLKQYTAADSSAFFSLFDTAATGRVKVRQFICGVCLLCRTPRDQHIRFLFYMFDVAGAGVLQLPAVTQALVLLNRVAVAVARSAPPPASPSGGGGGGGGGGGPTDRPWRGGPPRAAAAPPSGNGSARKSVAARPGAPTAGDRGRDSDAAAGDPARPLSNATPPVGDSPRSSAVSMSSAVPNSVGSK